MSLKRSLKKSLRNLTKKQKIALGLGGATAVGLGGLGIYNYLNSGKVAPGSAEAAAIEEAVATGGDPIVDPVFEEATIAAIKAQGMNKPKQSLWERITGVKAFGRRRRSRSRSRRTRRRSGRRGNPQAAEAMRLMRSKGISLKAAWKIVKGGKGGKGRSRRKSSRRRHRRSKKA